MHASQKARASAPRGVDYLSIPHDAEKEFARLHSRLLVDKLIRDSSTVDFLRDITVLEAQLKARGDEGYMDSVRLRTLPAYVLDIFHRIETLFARIVHASPLIGAHGVADVMTPQMRLWFDVLIRRPWGVNDESHTVKTLLATPRRGGAHETAHSSRIWEYVCHLLEDELLASSVAPELTDAMNRLLPIYQTTGVRGVTNALANNKDVRLWFWHVFGFFYRVSVARSTITDDRAGVVLGTMSREARDMMQEVISRSHIKNTNVAWTPVAEQVRATLILALNVTGK